MLGGYYGTGRKKGLLSSFLMGCRDGDRFLSVAKVANGLDDGALDRLDRTLKPRMVETRGSAAAVPRWLGLGKLDVPHFVMADTADAPVWEIRAAELTDSTGTAASGAGISMRFPRLERVRDDKQPVDATSLAQLKSLRTMGPAAANRAPSTAPAASPKRTLHTWLGAPQSKKPREHSALGDGAAGLRVHIVPCGMAYAAAERLVLAAGGELVMPSRYKDAALLSCTTGATHMVADTPATAWPQASRDVLAQSFGAKVVPTAWLLDRIDHA